MVPKLIAQGYKLFVLDEATFCIQPKVARGWFLKGSRPTQKFAYVRAHFHCYGAQGHNKSHYMFGNGLNSKWFLKFLKKLHAKYPLILAVLDNAKWHKTPKIFDYCKQNCILIELLPPYSPNLNSIEQWWKKLKYTTANRMFHTEQQLRRHINSEARKKKNLAKMFPYLSP